LDPQEARAFKCYPTEDLAVSDDSDKDDYENENSFTKQADARYEAKAKKTKNEFPYRSTMHVCVTSVTVERLFNRCGIIIRPHIGLMEMLVMLRFNRDLWDEFAVESAIKEAETVGVPTPSQLTTPGSSSSSCSTAQVHLLLLIVININIFNYI
jgi:hypothetical protein